MISVKTLYRWKGLSLTHYNRDKTLTDWIKASKTRQLLERVLDPHSCHHQEKGELCKGIHGLGLEPEPDRHQDSDSSSHSSQEMCEPLCPCEAGIIKASEFKVREEL